MWSVISRVVIAYDGHCLDGVKTLLMWLNDWLSITQRRFEYVLIGCYMVCVMFPTTANWLLTFDFMSALLVGGAMFILTRLNRNILKDGLVPVRLTFQVLFLVYTILLFFPPHHYLGDIMNVVRPLIYGLFSYSVAITIDRDPGRRRKLAWEQATEWWRNIIWTPPYPVPR